ncbi:hypothetical protein Tco_0821147, partial [Tanacetum coccineum]
MAAKFEIEKFNGNNFSLWKLKMKVILRKDKCLAAIGERPAEVTDDNKWDGKAVKGYHLWDPTSHKVVVSRDVVFMEDKIQENKEGNSTIRETTSIQMEKEFQANDSFEAAPQHE